MTFTIGELHEPFGRNTIERFSASRVPAPTVRDAATSLPCRPSPRPYFRPKYRKSGPGWSLRVGISLPSALRK